MIISTITELNSFTVRFFFDSRPNNFLIKSLHWEGQTSEQAFIYNI